MTYKCVANQMKYRNQQTVTWNVNDLKYSHMNPKVNEKFAEWCKETYGSDDLGHVEVVRGKIHDYLGMIIYFTQKGVSNIDMKYYIKGELEEIPLQDQINQNDIMYR